MKKSYMEKACLANVIGDDISEVIGEGIDDIFRAVQCDVVDKYEGKDIPVIVAVMEAIAQGLRNEMKESGNWVADEIKRYINVVIVDDTETSKADER